MENSYDYEKNQNMRWQLAFSTLLILSAITGIMMSPSRPVIAAGPIIIHRYYNHEMGDHFYTPDPYELGVDDWNDGWIYEGTLGGRTARYKSHRAFHPLYRCWSPSATDHLYTINKVECTDNEYTVEGHIGFVMKNRDRNLGFAVALHRYYHPEKQDHLYTTAWSELGGGRHGYVYEGIAGWMLPLWSH